MSCSPPRKCIQIRPRNDQFQIKFNRKFYFPRATSSNFNCKDEKKEKQETNDHGDGRTSWEPVQRERKRERERRGRRQRRRGIHLRYSSKERNASYKEAKGGDEDWISHPTHRRRRMRNSNGLGVSSIIVQISCATPSGLLQGDWLADSHMSIY